MTPREQLESSIIAFVRKFEDNFALGVRHRIISQRFSKRAQRLGLELTELLDDMHAEKKLYLHMNRKGATLIMVPEIREQLKEDDFGLLTEAATRTIEEKWGHLCQEEN